MVAGKNFLKKAMHRERVAAPLHGRATRST